MRNMFTKIYLIVMTLLTISSTAFGQCTAGSINSTGNPLPGVCDNVTFVTNSQNGNEQYCYTVIVGNEYYFETCGNTSDDTQLTVFEPAGTSVAFNDDGCSTQSSVSYIATTTEICVQVNQYNCISTGGPYDITVKCYAPPPPPSNDECSSAEALTLGMDVCGPTLTGDNTSATSSSLSPGCGSYNGGDVWYKFTAPASGAVTITTTSGTISDCAMAIYDACGGTLIECDDDDGPGTMPELIMTGLTGGTEYHLAVWEYGGNSEGTFDICAYEVTCTEPTFTVAEGTNNCPVEEFYIDVAVTDIGSAATGVDISDGTTTFHTNVGIGTHQIGPYGAGVTVTVRVADNGNSICYDEMNITTTFCPPSNDECINSIDISGVPDGHVESGNTDGATAIGAPPTCVTSLNEPGVWYRFQAESVQDVTIELCNSDFDTKLGIFTGSCGSFICETGNDDYSVYCTGPGTTSAVTFTAQGTATQTANKAGLEDYYVYVTGYNGATGNFELGIHTADAAPLPLEWNEFSAKSLEKGALLEWSTLTEINVSHFELLKSNDGLSNWNSIYQVKANNSTGKSSYEYMDPEMETISYYKVRSIDFDGQESYSAIVNLKRDIEDKINLIAYPNPVFDSRIQLKWNYRSTSNMEIVLTDIAGRIVLTQKVESIDGINEQSLRLGGIQSGVYNLRVLENDKIIGYENIVIK